MKTVAIITSLDTKSIEAAYLSHLLKEFHVVPFIIDIGAQRIPDFDVDIDAVEIAESVGQKWISPFDVPKSLMIETLREGLKIILPTLYQRGVIDGCIGFGGLQNTIVCTQAMMLLPLGVPKFIVSSVACGNRTFDSIVGSSDIVVMPSVTDFTGRNMITDQILRNAAAAISGMVIHYKHVPLESSKTVVGISLMGVVTKGATQAIDRLRSMGFEVLSFHSTGVGGKVLDNLIANGTLDIVLEYSSHELVGELLGGYSTGTKDRLLIAAKNGVPQVVTLGGLDFIDFSPNSKQFSIKNRKHVYHNPDLIHAKVTRDEARIIGSEVARRLNQAVGSVVLMIPTKGFRQNTEPGGLLDEVEIDLMIIEEIERHLSKDIPVIRVEANINDQKFSDEAVNQVVKLRNKRDML